MFKRVFIANRGEVAGRVLVACKKLGIETVCGATQADLDSNYSYLEEADEFVNLGPGPAAESFLNPERLVQAAVQTQCSALHPGWGFLAEHSGFAALCEQHGVTFIGPSPESMDLMSLKIPARAAAETAGLPVVPGSQGILGSVQEALEVAQEVGYPVALKADAGGGGKGIRRCDRPEDLQTAFDDATRESLAAFGNAHLYLEKYIQGGYHIEFQVFGDGQGRTVHLFDRECSIQRRHQKLVEEAPSPNLSEAKRAEVGALAAAAAAHWNYKGAGTMEFLMDSTGDLWFLEMNTRLQVEHTVTEMVTGTDLACAQIQVAAGNGLPWSQSEISLTGHAIEVRINAEDAEDHFKPHPGKVNEFQICGEGIRVETHLANGSSISPHYDSLMAKVIAHGEDRETARMRLASALEHATLTGIPTTLPLHRTILGSTDFQSAACDTLWLDHFLNS